MPTQSAYPDNPSEEIAAERERAMYLLQVVARLPQAVSRAGTALSHGYTREECVQRWGEDFAL
jgi:hypothetical protein